MQVEEAHEKDQNLSFILTVKQAANNSDFRHSTHFLSVRHLSGSVRFFRRFPFLFSMRHFFCRGEMNLFLVGMLFEIHGALEV